MMDFANMFWPKSFQISPIWIIMIACGLANFAGRFIMFSGLGGTKLPNWAQRYLAFVPTAVLSAIIAAALFIENGAAKLDPSSPKFIAAIFASIVAVISRSVLLTIGVGLGVLWGIS